MTENKIKCYELDFGDTNLIDKDITVILGWIESEAEDMKPTDELNYKITLKYMTQEEYDNLPEWA